MTSITHVVGIDPGLVHTGVVGMSFDPDHRQMTMRFLLLDGADTDKAADWIQDNYHWPFIFIEKYIPRLKMGTDKSMVAAEAAFKQALPAAKLVNNTGSKAVVTTALMRLLNVWTFPVTTHHQDLRAAARIALYGMVKRPELNELLANIVSAHLYDNPWEMLT